MLLLRCAGISQGFALLETLHTATGAHHRHTGQYDCYALVPDWLIRQRPLLQDLYAAQPRSHSCSGLDGPMFCSWSCTASLRCEPLHGIPFAVPPSHYCRMCRARAK